MRAEGVWFRYGGAPWALEDVTAGFAPGVTAIVGPNGSGKSTLVRLLAGLAPPSRGAVTIDGRPVRAIRAADRASRIAYIAQRPEVAAGFTVREVVELGRFALARNPRAVDEALGALGIAPLAERPWRELSVGQQQLVSVARAVAQLGGMGASGGALLADEPTAAMDPVHVARTIGVLRSLAARGVAVVLVAHDVALARASADRAVLVGAGGRIAAQGTVGETLTPDRLGVLFGVRFFEARTEGGIAITPESQVARGV
jgi:iron complex transport system ATP-binding protein